MRKIREAAKAGLRSNLGTRALLIFTVLVISLLLLQVGSVSSAEPQTGAARGGVSVWHEVSGVGLLNITPEVAKVGETVLYNYTAYAPFNLGLNLTIKFENDEGYLDYVEVFKNVQKTATLANVSTEQLFNPSNASFYNVTTVNTSILTTFVKEWVATPTVKYGIGSDYYYTAKFVTGEQVRYKPKAKVYGGIIKYDAILHPSNLNATQPIRIEIDPVLNATAANITSNSDLNLSASTARFVPPTNNLILGAGNGSNLTEFDTFSDSNFNGWTTFNRSASGNGCGSTTRVGVNKGSLNITSEQVGTSNCFATAWILTNHSINKLGGVVVTAKINTSNVPSTGQVMMCYANQYDKLANSTSGNPPSCYGSANSGYDGLVAYFDGDSTYHLASIVDAGVVSVSASYGTSSRNSVETWRVYVDCITPQAQLTINEVSGEGTAIEGAVYTPNAAADLCSGGAFGIQAADNGAGVNTIYVDNYSIANASVFGSPFNLTPARFQTNVLNSTITTTSVKITNITASYANTAANFYVFDANHANLQSVTEGSFNTINSITGIGINATFVPADINTVTELTSILLEWSTAGGGGPSNANEAEGDTAIELGINSSLASATKYSEQQVYVRNLSNNQTLGTFDRVASFGSQRWLLNYVTSGESYVNAPNLTTAVYVLEITNKTSAQITDEVSRHINATKS
ncbi:hypothetical protein HYV83_00510 [Candidatus Woesearchaeota archaeon]|nr:hypothetical protein [Candidatus Woesearchaeota archaeon]